MDLLALFLRDPRRAAIALTFAIHGSVVGSVFSRLAELRLAMGLSEAELGVALIGLPAGVFTGSLVVRRYIERHGTRAALLVALPCFAAALVLTSFATGQATLFGVLILYGFALTSCNISMNVEADRVEAATGKRLINRCHGTWGLGFLFASLIGTLAVAAGIPPRWHFIGVLIFVSAATFLIVGPMQPSPPRAHSGAVAARRLALPTVGVLLVLGYACAGVWLEGSARNWSVIYLREDFDAAAWVATLTLPAIVGAQITGRFLADTFIDRFGPVAVGIALSIVSLAGLALVVAAPTVAVALVGFALVGLGISTTHPQALSAAARLGDRPASQNVAALSTIQTVISFVAPPIFGFVASRYGIQVSFAILLPLPIIAIFFARFLAPRQNAPR
ncbi:MFS transporter [soil metagenome]